MTRRLIARLHDGSEHEVVLNCDVEQGIANIIGTSHRHWIDVTNGKIRHESVAALLIVEDDPDLAINELLRDLHARGGATLEEVRRELERRGIELPVKSRTRS